MIRLPFIWRLYASFVAVILILATLTSVIGARRIRSQALNTMQSTLLDEAILLQDQLKPRTAEELERLRAVLADAGKQVSVRVTLIAADGTVLADTDQDAAGMENHAERPEIVQAREDERGLDIRRSQTLRREMMYMAIPVRDGDELLGFVRTSLPIRLVEARIVSLRNSIVLAATIAGTIALFGAWFFARKVTQPLRDMTLAASSIAEGKYDQNLHTRAHDEIGLLAIAFNRMSRQLREHMDTIEADRGKIVAILRSMSEALVAIDVDERIVHINAVAGRMLQADVEGAIGRPVQEVVRQHELCDALRRVLRDHRGEKSEIRIRRALHDQVLELHSSVLQDNQGDVGGALLVLSDASELRRLEVIRSDFVSNVSHEMKTPVAAIKGLVESILDDPGMSDDVRMNFLQRVEQQCIRLGNLVTDLLGLAAAERGGGLDSVPVELHAICASCVADQREGALERGLTLSFDDVGAVRGLGDADAIRLILDNLVTNAIRYTPEGGSIVVRALHLHGRAAIEVRDTGIGIEPTHQERIFERFYRVDKARSRELGGTGLGLAIVKHLALAMNGEIQLESAPGAGALFRVLLPGID